MKKEIRRMYNALVLSHVAKMKFAVSGFHYTIHQLGRWMEPIYDYQHDICQKISRCCWMQSWFFKLCLQNSIFQHDLNHVGKTWLPICNYAFTEPFIVFLFCFLHCKYKIMKFGWYRWDSSFITDSSCESVRQTGMERADDRGKQENKPTDKTDDTSWWITWRRWNWKGGVSFGLHQRHVSSVLFSPNSMQLSSSSRLSSLFLVLPF